MIKKVNETPVVELDEKELAAAKAELEDLIKTVPYTLSVALIKITQINNYAPMDFEQFYQKILPAFPLLRRTDGSRYLTHSMNTVRSAMFSNKLYYKNKDNLYVLNIPNAIKIIKMIKGKKKPMNEEEVKNLNMESLEKIKNGIDNNINFDNFNMKNADLIASTAIEIKNNNYPEDFVGKKRKLKKIKKKGKDGVKNRIEKFEKTFLLLKNLLKASSTDKLLYSQLNFDFADVNDANNLGDKKLNVEKVIGMLSVFKFFKPFIERCFSSIDVQENIMIKIAELNAEVCHMNDIFRFDD